MQVTGEPCSGNQVLAEFRPQQVPGSVKVPQTGFPESGSGPEFDVLGKVVCSRSCEPSYELAVGDTT